MYDEIEIEVFKGDSKGTEMFSINTANINYYRGFTDDTKSLKSILYMQGSVKGIILNVGYEYMRKQLTRHNRVKKLLMAMNEDQLKKVEEMIK